MLFKWSFLILQLLISSLLSSAFTPFLIKNFLSDTLPAYELLIPSEFNPETEVHYYVIFVCITGILMFFSHLLIKYFQTKSKRIELTTITNYLLPAITSAILISAETPFPGNILSEFSFYVTLLLALSIQYFFIRKPLPETGTVLLLIIAIIRFMFPAYLEYDLGIFTYAMKEERADLVLSTKLLQQHYVYFLLLLPFFIPVTQSLTLQKITSRFKTYIFPFFTLLTCLVLLLVILPLLKLKSIDGDIYFTTLPAYHLVNGGVPFVDLMSQYGILYLLPWSIWFLLFPSAPATLQLSTIISVFFIYCLFCYVFLVLERITKNPFLSFLGTIAGIYSTVIVRSFYFTDSINIVSGPAFTPLRFSPMLFPLLFLTLFMNSKRERFLYLFIISSVIVSIFSFEVGMGVSLAGIATALLTALISLEKPQQKTLKIILLTVVSYLLLVVCISVITLVSRNTLPDFSFLYYFSKLFSSGFYQINIGSQSAIWVPIFFSVVSIIVSVISLAKKQYIGAVLLYIALNQLVLLPYYIGRSLSPVLVTITLPTSLMLTILTVLALRYQKVNHPFILIGKQICFGILLLALLRVSDVVINQWKHPSKTTHEIGTVINNALFSWPVKEKEAYIFLSQYLNHGDEVILFDLEEEELMVVLKLRPATPYSFIRNFIVSREQINENIDWLRGKTFYVFVNSEALNDFNGNTYTVFNYYWESLKPYAKPIAIDGQLALYTVSVPK